jgi:hypothetical protein
VDRYSFDWTLSFLAPSRFIRAYCEHTFVRSYGFRVIEHDPERPWVIVGSGRHRVELEPDIDFYEWARERWPADRFTVELDPWSLTPK